MRGEWAAEAKRDSSLEKRAMENRTSSLRSSGRQREKKAHPKKNPPIGRLAFPGKTRAIR